MVSTDDEALNTSREGISLFIDKLFDEKKVRWGLRGSPYLWRDLKEATTNHDSFATAEEFEKFIYSTIPEILESKHAFYFKNKYENSHLPEESYKVIYNAERDKLSVDRVVIESYNHGGMSGGVVSLKYWKDESIPLLVKRYADEIISNVKVIIEPRRAWELLGIEETFDARNVSKAYTKMVNQTPIEDIARLREITRASIIARDYTFEIRYLGKPYDSLTFEKDKAEFDEGFYGTAYAGGYGLTDDFLITKKLITTLEMIKAEEITVGNLEEFIAKLTYERTIKNNYFHLLIAELKCFLTRHVDQLFILDKDKFRIIEAHFEYLDSKSYDYVYGTEEFREFWKWFKGFYVEFRHEV